MRMTILHLRRCWKRYKTHNYLDGGPSIGADPISEEEIMPEYDSSGWIKYPLVCFLLVAALSQITIALFTGESHAAPAVASAAPLQIYPFSQGAPPTPVKVELPARQEMKQTIAMEKPHAPASRAVSAIPSVNGVQAVIQFALAQRGKPYVWAASGPNSYDCSGLVLASFGKIGLRLPHFTGALIGLGRSISRAAMQPGDIVFPQKGHVGIYLGNNQMVHAPQPGEVVTVGKVYAFYAARRLA